MENTKEVVEQSAPEAVTGQTSSPQVETPTTGGQTIQGGETDQTPVVEETDVTSTMTPEQRRAFQEMRLENKRLKEEREAEAGNQESAFNMFRAQPTPPVQTQPVRIEQFTDPITGEPNWQAYNAAQQQREQMILLQAKAEARSEVQEVMDEERARAKYPELMNNPATEQLIAAQWFMESKLQGKPVSVTQIAEKFARNFKQAVSKAEKVGADRILTEVSEKEKAGLVATSQSSSSAQRSSRTEDLEQLSEGTRRGNQDAITARISKIPWANK